jgi:hypothetical protein
MNPRLKLMGAPAEADAFFIAGFQGRKSFALKEDMISALGHSAKAGHRVDVRKGH